MSLKILMLAAAGAILLFPAPKASAADSILPMSPDPLEQCANFAARAETSGVASDLELKLCGQAIARAKGMRDELAAAYVNRSVIHLARLEYDAALADTDAAIRIESTLPPGAYQSRDRTLGGKA